MTNERLEARNCEGLAIDAIRFPTGQWGAVIVSQSRIGQQVVANLRCNCDCLLEVSMHFINSTGDEYVMGRIVSADGHSDPDFLIGSFVQAVKKAGRNYFDEH